MRKLIFLALIALLVLMLSCTGQAILHHPDIVMWSEKNIYAVGEKVVLHAENTGDEVIGLPGFGGTHIVILNEGGERVFWSPYETCEIIQLPPGGITTWSWGQTYATWILVKNQYGYWDWVKAPNYGQQVPEGLYTAEQWVYGSVTFRIGYPDYPGASDAHRQDKGHGDICLHWASNEHAKGRQHAADS